MTEKPKSDQLQELFIHIHDLTTVSLELTWSLCNSVLMEHPYLDKCPVGPEKQARSHQTLDNLLTRLWK